MDQNDLIVLLITIGIILVVNFVMFGIVRGVTRGDNRWLRSIADTLSKPNRQSHAPYDELRQRMEDLDREKQEAEEPRE